MRRRRSAAGKGETQTLNSDSGPCPKALIVEDDDLLRGLLCTAAADLGCEVAACGTVQEGLDATARGWFDLIISDVRLPDAPDGRFYRDLAAGDPLQAARVVFVTGDLMNPATRLFIEQSGRPAVAKPFGLLELKRRLADVLDHRTGR